MKRTFLLTLSVLFAIGCNAQMPAHPDVVTAILQDSVISLDQPEILMERLIIQQSTLTTSTEGSDDNTVVNRNDNTPNAKPGSSVSGTVKSAGYRVQVFSDSNIKTAKNEARSMAQSISTRLPEFKTYVVYQSPYWRLKVGDFITYAEAEAAADKIKKIFPNYAREIRIVKDRINRQ